MSTFVLNRNYQLQLPESFVDVEREEMEYVDGGSIPRWLVSAGVDAIAMATPVGYALAPLKFLGKSAAIALVKRFAPQLGGFIAWAARSVLGAAINMSSGTILSLVVGNASCLTSVGGLVGLVADAADGKINGRIG